MAPSAASAFRRVSAVVRGPVFSGALGLGLAVAVLLAIGRRDASWRNPSASPIAAPRQVASAPPSVAVAASPAAAAGPAFRAVGAITVYLARTADEARTTQAWLAVGKFGGGPGGAPQNAAVIVTRSEAEAEIARAAVLSWLGGGPSAPALVDPWTIARH